MRIIRGMGVAAAVFALTACAGDAGNDTGAQSGDTTAQTPATSDQSRQTTTGADIELPAGVTPEMVAQGGELFNQQTCYTCHGMNASGGPLAPALTDENWLNADGSLESITQIIREGVADPVEHPAPMPAMGGASLSDEQIQQLAAYVYAVSRGG